MFVQASAHPDLDDRQLPDQSVITFPDGLPGLGDSRRFHILKPDEMAPILLLQDCENEHVSLPTVPVELVDPSYDLRVSDEDRADLAADIEGRRDLLCLTVLILPGQDHPPTCNLLAPIVINTRSMLGKQVIQVESDYPSLFPLTVGS